ncbi:endonuclease/exonuclease/phosphatase family protein [Ferrimonas balearica]|nr:endonuclease/exonuclease/phosphatase family protein [Ferrimonas balearica]
MRLAYFDTELARDGPGLLLRDVTRGTDPQVGAVLKVISAMSPDILVLAGIDADAEARTLAALNAALPAPYPHLFTALPNAGLATGRDMDGNGRRGEARDAQGYGRFTGEGGLALLSRWPIGAGADHSALLWQDLPDSLIAANDPGHGVQRLSSMVHWVLPVETPQGVLYLGLFRATTPVFDGPEDRNGRRNHDEVIFWRHLLDGALPRGLPLGAVDAEAVDGPRGLPAPFVILGGANLDPKRGEGRREAIRELLKDPRLQDPAPRWGAPDATEGDTTVDWPAEGPGRMRVDYVLPSVDLILHGEGVFWPIAGAPMAETVAAASRHRLIWVEVALP